VDPRRPQRFPRAGTLSHTGVLIAVMAAALSVASMARIVYNMATLADLFSVFAFPIALFIYRLARSFAERSRAAHESSLREKDKKDIDHATAAIRTCHSVVLGISRSSAISSPNILILTQSLAITIGAIKTQHGHLLTETGLRAAESARNSAELILESGDDCLSLNTSCIAQDLKTLSNNILPLDDESLVERRRQAADAESPA